ncbi:hypothetical protein ACFFHM_09975 [Halalkalibacter kiskunsagensis]|uniref:ABC-2 type transport system permease protein n=1 Tax=Halalkalibacter kiskunsagensis TaxID=1548599 RepID=A0ABV6KBY5_9BACI
MVQQALWLAKKELRSNWVPLIFTAIVTVFFALFSIVLLEQASRKLFGTETMYYNDFLLDIMFVGLTPSLAAIFMQGPYLSFRTVTEDTFSKRMALLRSLPIPVNVLALSRTFTMLATLLIMSSIFYIVIVIGLSNSFFQFLSTTELMMFILIWFGYSLALGGVNPFIEYGTNGKILHLTPFIFLGAFITTMIIFRQIFEHSIVEWSLLLVKDYGWMIALISVVIGFIGCYVWNTLLKYRLDKRDYL